MFEIIPNWHPVFVHYTVALLSVSLVVYIVAMVSDNDQLRIVARWNLWIGAAITLATVVAGWYAFNTVEHDDPSHAAMIEHRNWALATVAGLLAVLIWSVLAARKAKPLGWGFIILFGVVGVLLASTAWHGGELVYRHGLGVMSLPKTDAHDHGAHAHDGGDEGEDHHADDHGHAGASGHDAPGMTDDDMGMDELGMDEMSIESMSTSDDHPHDDDHDHDH